MSINAFSSVNICVVLLLHFTVFNSLIHAIYPSLATLPGCAAAPYDNDEDTCFPDIDGICSDQPACICNEQDTVGFVQCVHKHCNSTSDWKDSYNYYADYCKINNVTIPSAWDVTSFASTTVHHITYSDVYTRHPTAATATVPPSTTAVITSSATISSTSNDHAKVLLGSSSTTTIIAGGIGGCFGGILVVALVVFLFNNLRSKKRNGMAYNITKSEGRGKVNTKTLEQQQNVAMIDDNNYITKSSYKNDITTEIQSLALAKINTNWTPLCLRNGSLLAFGLCFGCCFVALQVLYALSVRNMQGLANASDKYYYLWTYGPTAFFTVVAAFWAHLDFRVKQLAPWGSLAAGSTSSLQSLKVDYIAALLPIAYRDAWRNRHLLPVATITGIVLLKLILIVSTNLFVLLPVVYEDVSVPIVLTTSTQNVNFSDSTILTSKASANDAPFQIVNGIHQFGLSYPIGTTDEYAVQSFTIGDVTNDTYIIDGISAEVEILQIDFASCSPGEVSVAILGGPPSFSPDVNITLPKGSDPTVATLSGFAYIDIGNNSQAYSGWIEYSNNYGAPAVSNGPYNWYITFLSFETDDQGGVTLLGTSSLVCPSLAISIQNATVHQNGPGLVSSGGNDIEVTTNSNANKRVLDIDVDTVFRTMLEDATQTINVTQNFDVLFSMLKRQLPEASFAALVDTTQLEIATRQIFRSIGAQVAKSLLVDSRILSIGTSTRQLQRLFIQSVSFLIIQICMALLLLIMLFITWKAADIRGVVSRDPDSLGAIATILAASPEFQLKFENEDESLFSERIRNMHFRTTMKGRLSEHTFSLDVVSSGQTTLEGRNDLHHKMHDISLDTKKAKTTWWRPLSLEIYMIALTLFMLIAIIVVLEILFRYSERNDGLTDIHTSNVHQISTDLLTSTTYTRYAWTYLPALIMLIMAMLVTSLDSAVKTIQPYHILKIGGTVAQKSILYNPLGKLLPQAIWSALKMGQWPVLFTIVASTFAAFLTIVVSGLFTLKTVPTMIHEDVSMTGWFNSTIPEGLDASGLFNTSLYDGKGVSTALTINLIVGSNLSYPKWTYGELALPYLELSNIKNDSKEANFGNGASRIQLDVPALRGNMNCSILPSSYYNFNYYLSDEGATLGDIQFIQDVNNCNYAKNGLKLTFDMERNVTLGLVTSHFSDNAIGYGSTNVSTNTTFEAGPGCPSNIVVFGRTQSKQYQDVHLAFCTPYVEQVVAKTQMLLPDFTIDETAPPVVNQSSASYYASDPPALIDFQGLLKPILNTNYTSDAASGAYNLDNIFKIILYGKSAYNLTKLFDNSTYLLDALQQTTGLITVQYLNVYARVPADNQNKNTTLSAAVTDASRLRLKQNMISTRILQGILGVILVCCIAAYATVRSKNLLKEEPTSIAASISLLLGSEMASRKVVPEGGEWEGQVGFWEGWVFSLGLWPSGDGKRRFGVDVGKAEKVD